VEEESRLKDQVLLLVKMQAVDLRKNQQQVEEKSLPEKLKAAESSLQKKKEDYAKLQLKSSEREKGKREKELDLKVQEEQIVKLRERLSRLKTNEEYKANLKEIEIAKVRKGDLEESLLVAMDEGDLLKKEIASSAEAVANAEKIFLEDQEKINAAIAALSESSRAIEAQWQEISVLLDKNILLEYKRLLTLRKGVAIASLNGKTCGGCNVSLPPQLVAEVKIGEKILSCTYCSRMLYSPATIEG
jgi:predicted  nucleic acid-binding Zn-ribbon protein